MTRHSLGPPRRTSFVVVARDRKVERPSWRCYGRGRGCLRRAVTVRTFIQKPLMSGQGLHFFKAPAQIPSTQPLCILRPGRALHLPGWAKQIIIYFLAKFLARLVIDVAMLNLSCVCLGRGQHLEPRIANDPLRLTRHEMALELVSRADCLSNRHCKTSPVDLEGSRGQVWPTKCTHSTMLGRIRGRAGAYCFCPFYALVISREPTLTINVVDF